MLNIRKFLEGIGIVPKTTTSADTAGEMEVLSSDNRLRYHDGTSVKIVTLNSASDTLTNKTIDADLNTITNIDNNEIKAGAAIDASKIADGSVSSTEFQFINSVTSNVQTQINNIIAGTTPVTIPLTNTHILVGNGSNVAADVAVSGDVTITNTGDVQITAGVIVDADINAAANIAGSKLADDGVTNAKLANMAAHTYKGNNTGSSADPIDITSTQLTADLNLFTSGLQGLVPASGGGTSNFLRADGTFAAPATGSTSPLTTKGDLYGFSTLDARIPVGSNDQVLTADSAQALGVKWATPAVTVPGFNGALNLTLLNTSGNNYTADKLSNFNAEVSVGDWVAYADAAGTAPVDMTGGSPNTTIARNTSSPLNGSADFLMTINSGASRQGEGVSCVVNIPPAYRGRNLAIKFPFATTGTIVENDFKTYAYDITNSLVIDPFRVSKLLGANGQVYAIFPVNTNTAQIRVGIHIARTTTGAATIKFDDVVVTPEITAVGMAGSDWIAYTPTVSSLGTVTSVNMWYRRVGDSLELSGSFISGTPTAAELRVSLPTNLIIDSSKVSAPKSFGNMFNDAATSDPTEYFLTGNGGNNYVTMRARATSGSKTFSSGDQFGSTMVGSGQGIYLVSTGIPIAGWSSNVSMAESATFKASDYLVNGTRVTVAPTKLGEYRTYTKDASAFTGTDNAPSGGYVPSGSNGLRIEGVPFGTAGTSGQPNRWEIFVGKNKNVNYQFFSSAGRTGGISTDVFDFTGLLTTYVGLAKYYDPTTGIVTIDTIEQASNTTSRAVGRVTSAQTGLTNPTDCYFDVVVSENALFVGAGGSVGTPTTYTQTIEAVTSNPTKGTTTIDKAYYMQSGKQVTIGWNYKQTSGGSAGSGNYIFPYPAGFVPDTNYITTDTQFGSHIGTFHMSNTTDNISASSTSGYVYAYSSTHFALSLQNGVNTNFIFNSAGTFNIGSSPIAIQVNINGLIVV